jgi:hypothetical protein
MDAADWMVARVCWQGHGDDRQEKLEAYEG